MIKFYKHFVCFFIVNIATFVSGQSLQDIQKMKSEYEKYQNGQQPQQIQKFEDGDQFDEKLLVPKTATIAPYKPQDNNIMSKTKGVYYYGYDFFNKRDSLSFWENLPAPLNYNLGAGDELVVSLWGETQLRKTYTISRDGNIYDDKVGLLSLSGKTIESSKKYLILQFGRVYATLLSTNPSTYMDVSLGQLGSINVNFVGEVKYPGVYPIHPFSTVITGLIQAGGVDSTGSLRNVKIKRNNDEVIIVDFYDYLLNGKFPDNIQLRDQDIILVPPRFTTIKIDSSVLRPGVYESKPGESIRQLIQFAGGLKYNSSNKIGLKRVKPIEERMVGSQIIENYYINYTNSDLTTVQDGDVITIKTIFENTNQVEIIGQVKAPGSYYFYQGMMLKDLLELGGGFNDSTFLKSIYQARGELVRRNPDTRYESIIEVKLKNIIENKSSANILLQNLDRFVVHANLNFFEKENIQIFGEVNIPGSYPLISDNENLESLLSRAGGLTPKALNNGVSIYRSKEYFENLSIDKELITKERVQNLESSNSVNEPFEEEDLKFKTNDKIRVAWQNESITLMPGDSIVVKQATNTINIFGEIYNPGLIEYRKGKSLRYYVNSAGGVTTNGTVKNIIIIYANGQVSPNKWYSSPKVEDGATIIVNTKEFKQPFDITQFATNWTQIISSVITAVILSEQLSGSN